MPGEKTKQSGSKKRLVLLDAHAIIHRAFHALPDFTASDGEPTGALYGLSAMLMKIIQELKPDYIVAAYDLPGPTKRHDVFDEYKAGREEMDVSLSQQIERSRDIFKAFSIPVYECPGFEADDIIGTIVEQLARQNDVDIVIASGDMDTLQLVRGKKVQVYTLRKGLTDTVLYDEKGVGGRYGFGPTLLPDFKGLMGDPSDNIPGVKGIGQKTATELVSRFGTIDDIYRTLKKGPEMLEREGIKPRIVNLLKSGEEEALFSKMLAEIRRDAPIHFRMPDRLWRESLDTGEVLKLFRGLSFRTLSDRVKKLFGGSVSEESSRTTESAGEPLPDTHEIRVIGLALSVLDSNSTNPRYEDILAYARTTSFAKARDHILSELKKQNLETVYERIELPLLPVVEGMESRGVRIDKAVLARLATEYRAKLESLEKEIFRHAGHEFNINSPRQLALVLYDELALVSKGKTAKGQRSTRESELEKIRDSHPIIETILVYRELSKLLSTYIENLPHLISPRDSRLHAHWIQIGAATGRMASQNPNLQNIPIRTEYGRAIRGAFVAEEGFVLATFDYSQIELRIAAFLSGDTEMIKIFKEGGDFHAAVAKSVFNEASADTRRRAKVINFGILYGMGSVALARAIGASRKDAQQYLDTYFKTFSGLADYIERTKLDARKRGYTETYFGRRRFFPGIASHLPYVRAEAERQAQNAPMQGTNADIIKIAMRDVDAWIRKEKRENDVYLVMQIHDELVYEIREEAVAQVSPNIRTIMESVLPPHKTAGVALKVDVAVGKNWGDTTPLPR